MIKSKKLKTALLMKKANASYNLILAFLYKQIFLRNKILKKNKDLINNFKLKTKDKYFSEFWFDSNIPHWQNIFEIKNLFNKDLNALEIGSYEGRSAYFLLTTLKKLKIECIDTWSGSDEHKIENWSDVENNFIKNMESFQGRVTKFKGSSSSWFKENYHKIGYYNLIYIDGSHYHKDVLFDAKNCWPLLKNNGILIFDDYLWKNYPILEENPIFGINQFLNSIENKFKILSIDYQIIIEKVVE